LEDAVHAGQTAWRNRYPTDSRVMRDDYTEQILNAHNLERLLQVGGMIANTELTDEDKGFLKKLYLLKDETLKATQ
jgi:hypothetical protein